MSANKKAKREEELKKAKRTKIITVVAVAAAILILAGAIGYSIMRSRSTETYSDGGQSVKLQADGSFIATLYHGSQYSGKYEKVSGGVNFIIDNGEPIFAAIQGGVMTLPEEWGDGHGHGSTLTKQ